MHPIVRYELKELEELILSLSLDNEWAESDSPSQLINIKNEVDRIRQRLTQEVLSFTDERHLERYIQYHQYALIHLMDKILSLKSDPTTNRIDEKTTDEVSMELENLLLFIEQRFQRYFDPDAKVPDRMIRSAQLKTKADIVNLEVALSLKEADQRLSEILIHAIRKIDEPDPQHLISFRVMNFSLEMHKELHRLIDSQISASDINDELRTIMYYLNYNTNRVLSYHAQYINSLLETTATRAEKIERLSLVLKNINQSLVNPTIKYNQHFPSLKDLLNNHIKEEIEYLEKVNQLNSTAAEHPSDPLLGGFKLKLTASVQQLAYLFRVLLETRLISNSNVSQVLQFLVKFVITKKSETVSFGSLRTKFYSVESSTKDSVRNMLQAIIHHIDKN